MLPALKKALAATLLAAAAAYALPISVRMQFDEIQHLAAWPDKAADCVTLDSEASFNGHGSLKIENNISEVEAYSGIKLDSSPAEFCFRFNARASQPTMLGFKVNFNLEGQGNGSNGSLSASRQITGEWQEHAIRFTAPAKSSSILDSMSRMAFASSLRH